MGTFGLWPQVRIGHMLILDSIPAQHYWDRFRYLGRSLAMVEETGPSEAELTEVFGHLQAMVDAMSGVRTTRSDPGATPDLLVQILSTSG